MNMPLNVLRKEVEQMNMERAIFIGLCYMGVQIDGIDKSKNIVYISVPEESVDYNQTSIKTPQGLARFIKDKVFGMTFNIKYKIRNENWTEDKKEQALNDIKMNYYEDIFSGGIF